MHSQRVSRLAVKIHGEDGIFPVLQKPEARIA
jgi:hypothetical protein